MFAQGAGWWRRGCLRGDGRRLWFCCGGRICRCWRVHAIERLLIGLSQTQHGPCIYSFGHPVEVDQETEKHLVGGRTVFMDSAEVAEDRYAGYVLAMKSQYARGLLAQPGCAFGGRYLAMQMIVLPVIGRGDLGQ